MTSVPAPPPPPGTTWPTGCLVDALTPDGRAALFALGRPRTYEDGARLFDEGATGVEVSVILDGRVTLTVATGPQSRRLVGVRARGDLVGEVAALDRGACPATATALGPVQVRAVPPAAFLGLLRGNAEDAVVVARSVAASLRAAVRRLADDAAEPVLVRLARLLVDLERGGGRIPLSHLDLAALLGTGEVSVHHGLTQLRQLGAIDTGRRGVMVRDLDALGTVTEADLAA